MSEFPVNGQILIFLVDVSNIFYFFCWGEGKGSPRHQEGRGYRSFIENPGGGASKEGRGGGAERVSARNLGGGGLNMTDFLPLLVLTCRRCSTGKNQYW